MERPKTPGLAGSDLQYGDVQRLEQAQRIAGLPRTQPPSTGGTSSSPAPPRGAPSGGGMQVPDPVEFAKKRFGNTLQGGATEMDPPTNVRGWLPLIRKLADSPSASGTLRNAFVTQLGAMMQAPATARTKMFDMDELDQDLQGLADGL